MSAKKIVAKKITKTNHPEKPKVLNGKVAAFTLDDVKSLLKSKKPETATEEISLATRKIEKKKVLEEVENTPRQAQTIGAASLADILGYNPAKSSGANRDEKKVPKKFKVYYDLLISLRDHVHQELDLHTRETLKKSIKDDSGDIASYSQHMADEGTDNFDRDFALSLVSSEQEALAEIEDAINRIYNGSYGVCEITGEPISEERLMAVPFTKHSLEGQKQLEKNRRFMVQRNGSGVYSAGIEDSTQFIADDDAD